MKHTTLVLAALTLLLGGVGQVHADAISVDFSSYADGTPLSSVNGITLSLVGGPGPTGVPVTGFGGVTNSTTGAYPTATVLDFTFASSVSNVSFTFDNLGTGDTGGRGDSLFRAFDANGKLLETGSLNDASGDTFSLTSSGIRELQFDNRTGGDDNWIFAVDTIQATTTAQTPEPSSLALLGLGIAGAAGYGWRRKRPATA